MEAQGRQGRRRAAAARALSCVVLLAPLLYAQALRADEAGLGDWWNENFEVHGFLRSRAYFRSPDFENPVEVSSWRNELNLEMKLRLYDEDDVRLGVVGVLRPVWDGVYAIQGDTWGERTRRADFQTSITIPTNVGFAKASGNGDPLPCVEGGLSPGCGGARVRGEFTVVNADVLTLFTGELAPAVAIDDVGFFGSVTAPVVPRSSRQAAIGGNATGITFEGLRDNFRPRGNGGLLPGQGLDRSLQLASQPLSTPLNFHRGALGDRGSLDRGSFDINRRQDELAFDCLDNAHPWCFVREFYLEGSYGNTFVRLGRQQIVWGKTDVFRLQDRVNPIDLGLHNIFPDLEERRIPVLALDVVHSFGDVGPLQDVSLELAWVFDRFIPDQFGQCGEPYAFTAACGARTDAGAHQLLNLGLAAVDEVHWKLENTQPGLRLDFRLPHPSVSLSLSGFYTFQETPVARFVNHYSASNPNPAALLFLQGLTTPTNPIRPVAKIIEEFSDIANSGNTVWTNGFDPYDHAPLGGVNEANRILLEAWDGVVNNPSAALVPGCGDAVGAAKIDCISDFALLALPWSGSEVVLEYPRLWALGASLDYEVPGIDSVLRMEIASDVDRHIQDTSQRDGVSQSSVFRAAVGLDRSTFIPFLNPDRTAFLSFQTFVEHIVDYRDRGALGGMVPYENSVISTAFMQNYWRNDSIVLTNFAAVDWQAGAVVAGPSLRWIYQGRWSFEIGANLLWGQTRKHNIRNLCADATLDCLDDPTTWQDGNWQTLNAGFARESQHPWWAQQSFADKFMRHRDEFWAGITYRF